jgi:hypothetical protein
VVQANSVCLARFFTFISASFAVTEEDGGTRAQADRPTGP